MLLDLTDMPERMALCPGINPVRLESGGTGDWTGSKLSFPGLKLLE